MSNAEVYKNIKEFKVDFMKDLKNPYDIIEIFKNKEDFLVLEFPNKMNISGITMIKKTRNIDYKCIYINTNDPIGRRNFSFLHEIYHVFYEKSEKGYSLKSDKSEIEKRAEIFASNILIPRELLLKELRKHGCKSNKEITEEIIFEIQLVFHASFQAVLYAINNLEKDLENMTTLENVNKLKKFIPIIPERLYMYFKKWDKLEEKTLANNKYNIFNSTNSEYKFPDTFKKNLIANYKNGKIDIETLNTLFEFFNADLEIEGDN